MRKSRLCFTVFVTIAIVGCQTTNPYHDGNGFDITRNVDLSSPYNPYNATTIFYCDYDCTLEEEMKALKNRMTPDYEIEKAISEIPSGGFITIKIFRASIGAANTKYFEYVLVKDGIEILRRSGSDNIAETPIYPSFMWRNLSIISVSQKLENRITLYVIDNLGSTRDVYEITR
jgi:hypothetical protein